MIDLKPDWVSICIGINDVWRQFDCPAITDSHVYPDEYEANVEKMIELLNEARPDEISYHYIQFDKEYKLTLDKFD